MNKHSVDRAVDKASWAFDRIIEKQTGLPSSGDSNAGRCAQNALVSGGTGLTTNNCRLYDFLPLRKFLTTDTMVQNHKSSDKQCLHYLHGGGGGGFGYV